MRQSEPCMIRLSEIDAMKQALSRQENLRPVEQVVYGENFRRTAEEVRLSPSALHSVKEFCAQFLLRLTQELLERLPSCLGSIEKMRCFAPSVALARRARPEFQNLPLDLLSK
ncbi:uncharacterized protein LOC122502951 [Leptopilina heterotoma]|uniref:uncharacterized protein LOC122502951 n=1 Tax=Leptopilina heterotoma TaxID=63436 RepID=UPI001CA8CB5F|nr:uncharacterized protein LOC122502951 [Leptopilina heterotoma]